MKRYNFIIFLFLNGFIISAFALSRNIDPEKLIDSSKVLFSKGDHNSAIQCLKKPLKYAKLKKIRMNCLVELLLLEKKHSELGQNDSAITICYKRLTINRLQKNYVSLSDNFRALNTLLITNIGTQSPNGLMDSCLYYALLSKNSKTITVAYTNYGSYISEKNKEKGLKYFELAIAQSNTIPNDIIYIYSRVQASRLLISIDSLSKAKKYLLEGLTKSIENNEKTQRTHIYLILGIIGLKEDRVNEAIELLHKSRNIAEKAPYAYYLPEIYQSLSQCFRSTNSIDSSFYYNDKANLAQTTNC